MPEKPDSPPESRPLPTPHDQLLKTVLWSFFPELIALVDPNLARRVDPTRLESLDKELFTDLPQGRRREVDLLVRARLRDGRPRLVLVHVEIETEFRKRHAARMLRYYFQIRSRFPDESVLPIALYLEGGPAGHRVLGESDRVAGFEVLRFRYHAIGLSQELAETHLDRSNALGWALAALMKSKRYSPAEHKLECLRRIATAGLDEARSFLLANIVETYLDLTGFEAEQYNRRLAEETYGEIRSMQLTWEEKHYYRGHEEGRAEGIVEGRAEGQRRTLIRLIEVRLGPLPDAIRKRLGALDDPDELDRLATRVLDAHSLDDLGLDG